MRHYEIVFLVHRARSEQVPAMVERYRAMVEKTTEPFTVRKTGVVVNLAYPIQKTSQSALLPDEC